MLLLILSWCDILALVVINVAAEFKVDIALCGGGRGCALSGTKSLSGSDGGVGSRLEGLQASWGIGDDSEVASERGSNVGGSGLWINLNGLIEIKVKKHHFRAHLVIDQTPLFKERMNAHNRTNIASKIATARSDSQVFDRVQTVGVDHEIAVVLVGRRGLASVAAVEELCQSLFLDGIDGVHVEPSGVARENDCVGLGDELIPCFAFQSGLARRRLIFSHRIFKTFCGRFGGL